MRFWQQLLKLMELTACGSLADHYKQITSSQACSSWCCIFSKNMQETNNQTTKPKKHTKKNCAQNIPTATAKDLRIRNAKTASGNAKSASVRKARKTSFGECKSDRGCRKLQGATEAVLIGRELELVWELNWIFQLVTYPPWSSHQSLGLTRRALTLTGFLHFCVGSFSIGEGSAFRPFQEFWPLHLEYGPQHRSLI